MDCNPCQIAVNTSGHADNWNSSASFWVSTHYNLTPSSNFILYSPHNIINYQHEDFALDYGLCSTTVINSTESTVKYKQKYSLHSSATFMLVFVPFCSFLQTSDFKKNFSWSEGEVIDKLTSSHMNV